MTEFNGEREGGASSCKRLYRSVVTAINESSTFMAAATKILDFLCDSFRCDAAGVRIKCGDDYPYYCFRGFSPYFLSTETYLLPKDCSDRSSRNGKPLLKCLCGKILRGEIIADEAESTAAGSFWTNDLQSLIAKCDLSYNCVNSSVGCPAAGYQSLALIPLICGDECIGLLQLCFLHPDALSAKKIDILETIALMLGGAFWRLHEYQCLCEDHARYRELVELLDEVVFESDLSGRLTSISSAISAFIGYSAEELIGKSLCDLFVCNAPKNILWDYIMKGAYPKNEVELRHKNGDPIWVQISNLPMFEAGQVTGVRGIIVNINQQRLAENKYQCLFREMLNGFALHELLFDERGEPMDYRFLAVNPAFERMTGLHESNIVGKTILELLPETERFWIETYGKVVTTGHPVSFRQHSQVLNKHFHVNAFPHGKGQFACIFNDITEEVNIEKCLRASEALHKSFLQLMPIPVFCKDIEGRYTRVNQAMCDFFHRPEELFVGKTAFDIAPLELAQVYVDADKSLLKSREPQIYDSTVKDYEGGVHDVVFYKAVLLDEANLVTGIVGAIMDVTARKRIAKALSESEERMKLALDGAELGMWDWNIPTGEIAINRRWAAMLGYDVSEIPPNVTSWESLVNPEDLPRVKQILDAHLSGKTDGYEAEMRMKHKDGNWVWIIDKGRVIKRDLNGRPLRACGTHLDITHKKSLELEANLRREQLLHADKLSTIGMLVASVMHEINNPVGVISLNAPALRKIYEQLHPAIEEVLQHNPTLCVGSIPYARIRTNLEQLLQGICGASERICRIVKTLKEHARPEATEVPSEVDLNDIANNAVQFLGHHLSKSTQNVSIALCPDLPVIPSGYPGRIEQVVVNILMNACQALTSPIQAIRLSTGFDNESTHLWVQVEDEGCGIPSGNLDRIATPFFTTKRSIGGSGLGLSICNSILKEHGGRLEIASTDGRGTTVRILLPKNHTLIR